MMDHKIIEAVTMALNEAWHLGQTYWQQADSEYVSQKFPGCLSLNVLAGPEICC